MRGHLDALATGVGWMKRNLTTSSSLDLELELLQIRSYVVAILAGDLDDLTGLAPRIASVAASTGALVDAVVGRGAGSKMLAAMRNEAVALTKLARVAA